MKKLLLLICVFACVRLLGQTTAENKWEQDIRNFEQQDASNPPSTGAVLFTGSSSIRFWDDLQKRFPTTRIIRRGFGGSETSDLIYFFDRIIFRYRPAKVFIYTGENDIAMGGKTVEQTVADFETLITRIREKLPETKIYIISLKPSPARKKYLDDYKKVNAGIKGLVRKNKNAYFINVFDKMLRENGLPMEDLFGADKLHMNTKGYDIWQKVLTPYLK
jgi:acyl-CoA synthetase (AMP-forming)/AMP-acid ligase II